MALVTLPDGRQVEVPDSIAGFAQPGQAPGVVQPGAPA